MLKPSFQVISHLEVRIPVPVERASAVSLKGLLMPDGAYDVDRTSKPAAATKLMGNGDQVRITRIVHDDGRHEIVAAYTGKIADPGAARFALDNVLFDLIDVGVFPAFE
jgi:hypothetical protein